MKYVPNRQKKCSQCGEVILYNEEYITTDSLTEDNDVRSTHMHIKCRYATPGSWAASGVSYPQSGLLPMWSSGLTASLPLHKQQVAAASQGARATAQAQRAHNNVVYGRFMYGPDPPDPDWVLPKPNKNRIKQCRMKKNIVKIVRMVSSLRRKNEKTQATAYQETPYRDNPNL